jgi:DNA polymerase-3 subunit alpha
VYQEQVMQIASALAGFTLGEADILRRAMGKKKAEVMQAQREKFIQGAIATRIPEKKAAKIFDLMEHFAGYGFNRSHSAAYALVAYQTAYLKANYPVYFMAALLTSEKTNTDKVVQYLNASRDMGIQVLPPDINESELDFAVVKEKIRFGLAAVKNVGESAIESILKARAKSGALRSLVDLTEEVDLRLVNKRVLESLVKSGSFDSFGVLRAQLAAVIDRALEAGQQVQRERESGQGSLLGLFGDSTALRRNPELERYPEIPEWSQAERLANEKATLGFFLSGHPLDAYQDIIGSYATCDSQTLLSRAQAEEKEVSIAGLVSGVRSLRTRKGDAMAVFRLEDSHGGAEVVVFPDLYRESFGILSNDVAVLVKGKPEPGEDAGKILASKILLLDEVRQRDATSIVIRIPLDQFFEDSLPHLREVLEQHRGTCPLKFELTRGSYRVTIRPHPFLRVDPSPELVTSLEAICGEGTVALNR